VRNVSNNYHLLNGSPCIDAGINANIVYDHDGVNRPQGLAYDIGAYEYIIPTSSMLINKENRISVFPNPANDVFYIQTCDTDYQIELKNIQGQIIFQKKNVQTINVSNLPSGIYIVNIISKNCIESQKIVIN